MELLADGGTRRDACVHSEQEPKGSGGIYRCLCHCPTRLGVDTHFGGKRLEGIGAGSRDCCRYGCCHTYFEIFCEGMATGLFQPTFLPVRPYGGVVCHSCLPAAALRLEMGSAGLRPIVLCRLGPGVFKETSLV